MKRKWKNPKGITPQKFETNDGFYRIEVSSEGLFDLKDKDGETFTFCASDLEIIIKLLRIAKKMNPDCYREEE